MNYEQQNGNYIIDGTYVSNKLYNKINNLKKSQSLINEYQWEKIEIRQKSGGILNSSEDNRYDYLNNQIDIQLAFIKEIIQ